jgi:hypothetical protein
MSPHEMVAKLREYGARYAGKGPAVEPAELAAFLALVAAALESHHHDLTGLKSAVARLEHHVRHPPPNP